MKTVQEFLLHQQPERHRALQQLEDLSVGNETRHRGASMSKSKLYKLGQHLKVSNGLYSHHGIYVGEGRVVHYAGKSDGLFDNSCSYVQETCLAQFAGQRTIYRVYEPEAKFTADEIVRRAKSRLGENRYSVITNNCEHFVSWCIHGEHSSEQVQRAGVWGGATAVGVGAARAYRASTATSTVVNTARLAVAASSSSSQAGLFVSAASGSGAVGATAALTAGGPVAGGSTAAGFVATGSTLLASPAAPLAAVALVTGGVVYGAGKIFDWW